jgi:hypothetical protein
MSKKTNKRGGFRKRSKTLAKLRKNNGGMPGKVPLASQSEDYQEFHEDQDNKRLLEEIRLEQLEEDRKVWDRYKTEDEKKAAKEEAERNRIFLKYGQYTKPEKNNWRTKVKDWWNNGAKELKGGSQKRRRQNKRKSSKNRSR